MSASDESTPWEIAVRLATALEIPIELLRNLYDLHGRQWRLEDATRNRQASTHSIAVAKSEVDAANAQRHEMIDAIDTAVQVTTAEGARFYSETVGELCDRLLIFEHKLAALERLPERANEPSAGPSSAVVGGIRKACAHLSVVVTQLVKDIAAGRAALPPRADVKIYDESADGSTEANSGTEKDVRTATSWRG